MRISAQNPNANIASISAYKYRLLDRRNIQIWRRYKLSFRHFIENLLWKQQLTLPAGGQHTRHSSGVCSQTLGSDQHTPPWQSERTGRWDAEAVSTLTSFWLEGTAAGIRGQKNEQSHLSVQIPNSSSIFVVHVFPKAILLVFLERNRNGKHFHASGVFILHI